MRIVELPIGDGKTVRAIELEFEVKHESWAEYTLLDGGRVRVKVTATKLFWIVDAQDKRVYLPDGSPHIAVNHAVPIIVASE